MLKLILIMLVISNVAIAVHSLVPHGRKKLRDWEAFLLAVFIMIPVTLLAATVLSQ
jgi:uncharacterized membrane protein YozB (DUF420 family)